MNVLPFSLLFKVSVLISKKKNNVLRENRLKKAAIMGKRPVNSTKGGKFMNPTDQARKVARKKELKRNKKLRQAVRAAAIKGTS